jgi:S1-C subfamily serine protease
VNAGNGGGPAFAIEDGQVIDVCVAMRLAPLRESGGSPAPLQANSGLAVIVPAKYVVELVQTSDIDWPVNED